MRFEMQPATMSVKEWRIMYGHFDLDLGNVSFEWNDDKHDKDYDELQAELSAGEVRELEPPQGKRLFSSPVAGGQLRSSNAPMSGRSRIRPGKRTISNSNKNLSRRIP